MAWTPGPVCWYRVLPKCDRVYMIWQQCSAHSPESLLYSLCATVFLYQRSIFFPLKG